MQYLSYVVFISFVHYYAHCWSTHAILLVQSPRPMTVVFGLGMRLHMHMCTRVEMVSNVKALKKEGLALK